MLSRECVFFFFLEFAVGNIKHKMYAKGVVEKIVKQQKNHRNLERFK